MFPPNNKLLWLAEITLAALLAVLSAAFAYLASIWAAHPNYVALVACVLSFAACLIALIKVSDALRNQVPLSPIALSAHKKNISLSMKYPNTIGLWAIYVVVISCAFVVFATAKNLGKFDGMLISTAVWIWMACQWVILVVAIVLSNLLDQLQFRRRLIEGNIDSPFKLKPHRIFLLAVASLALVLYLPTFPMYILPAFNVGVFEIVSSPQEKLNKEFVREMNILTETSVDYNKNTIYDYVGRGADINTVSAHGTPLSFAARAGDPEFVKDLISKGANVKLCDVSEQRKIDQLLKSDYKASD